MKKLKLVLVVLVILAIQIYFTYTAYSIPNGASKIEAVLVLDASGSMAKSDPKGISFEAANMFIDMCSVQGDKIGIIAYSDKIIQQVAPIEIKSADDKKQLKSIISGIQKKSATDIGLGLKTAVQMLDASNDPSRKPLIILLSDGKAEITGSSRTKEQSEIDKKDAIQIAAYKGYPIYTIGLNADGTVDQNELKQISSASNAKTFITDTPDNLPQILSEIFADNLKLKIVSPGYINGTGDFKDVKISIPDSNVIEANISLLSQNPVEVKLLDNNGQEQTIPSSNIYYSVSSSYSMIKIISPKKGDWTLRVKGLSGDKIKVNLIFNYDLKLVMDLSPQNGYHKGDTIKAHSYLVSNGVKLQDVEAYKDMKAYVNIKDIDSSTDKKIDLSSTGDSFGGSFKLQDNHKYEIKAVVDAKSFLRESESVIINISNKPPIIAQTIKSIKILKGQNKSLDLSKVFTDPDGDALTFKVSASPADIASISVNGSILSINSKSTGNSTLTITADDNRGGKVDLTAALSVVSIVPYIIVGILLICLILFLILLLPIIKRARKPFVGQVMIEVRDLNTNKMSPPQYRRLDTYRGRVTMYELLQLLPEYKEGEKIVLTPSRNDNIIIKNMTQSTIEKTGRTVDAIKGYELKFTDRITINLSTVQKSITLEYFN